MRPAPPRGAVFEQLAFECAEFHDDSVPDVSPLGPRPSECPTCPNVVVASDDQSPQVNPTISVPSAFEPVMMSCSTGAGDPVHWPLIGLPCSSTKMVELPVRECRSARLAATVAPLALTHGPLPIRERASVGRLPLSGSCSTLRYACHNRLPAPAALASVWQRLSAPRRPPRLPVIFVLLVTKKLIVDPTGVGAALLLVPPQAETATASASRAIVLIARGY